MPLEIGKVKELLSSLIIYVLTLEKNPTKEEFYLLCKENTDAPPFYLRILLAIVRDGGKEFSSDSFTYVYLRITGFQTFKGGKPNRSLAFLQIPADSRLIKHYLSSFPEEHPLLTDNGPSIIRQAKIITSQEYENARTGKKIKKP